MVPPTSRPIAPMCSQFAAPAIPNASRLLNHATSCWRYAPSPFANPLIRTPSTLSMSLLAPTQPSCPSVLPLPRFARFWKAHRLSSTGSQLLLLRSLKITSACAAGASEHRAQSCLRCLDNVFWSSAMPCQRLSLCRPCPPLHSCATVPGQSPCRPQAHVSPWLPRKHTHTGPDCMPSLLWCTSPTTHAHA